MWAVNIVTAPVLGSKPSTAGVLPAEEAEEAEEEEEDKLALRVRRSERSRGTPVGVARDSAARD